MSDKKFKLSNFLIVLLFFFCINLLIGLFINSVGCLSIEINTLLILTLLFSFVDIVLVIAFYEKIYFFFMKKQYGKVNYENLDNFKYYRELLREYSISELAYIYDKKTSCNNLVALELNYLIKENSLKIEDNKLIIMDRENLNYIQNYLLDSINFIDSSEFKLGFIKELEKKLIDKGIFVSLNNSRGYAEAAPWVIIFGLFLMCCLIFINQKLLPYAFLFWFLLIMFLSAADDYKIKLRSRKGEEIYLKLRGLKKYLNDFNNFDEKQLEEIHLWDEYMLYAIILEEGKEAKEEMISTYNDILDKLENGNLKIIDNSK